MKNRPKNTAWRDGDEKGGGAAGGPAEQPRSEREHRPDRPDRERHADEPADDGVLTERPVEPRHDPVHQREFHPDVRLRGPTPAHLGIEEVIERS